MKNVSFENGFPDWKLDTILINRQGVWHFEVGASSKNGSSCFDVLVLVVGGVREVGDWSEGERGAALIVDHKV